MLILQCFPSVKKASSELVDRDTELPTRLTTVKYFQRESPAD